MHQVIHHKISDFFRSEKVEEQRSYKTQSLVCKDPGTQILGPLTLGVWVSELNIYPITSHGRCGPARQISAL